VAGVDVARAAEIAETLRREISSTHVPGLDIPLSASLGVAVMPEHGATPEGLLRQADRALYRAKELGRNRVELALPPGSEGPALDVDRLLDGA
jgi:diguanylate cyclase (GGDEF)-like protein